MDFFTVKTMMRSHEEILHKFSHATNRALLFVSMVVINGISLILHLEVENLFVYSQFDDFKCCI